MKKILVGVIVAYLVVGILIGGNEWLKDMATFDCSTYGYDGGSIFEPTPSGCERRGMQASSLVSVATAGVLFGPIFAGRLLFPEPTGEV